MNVLTLLVADDLEIEMTLDRGKLAYTFERHGKRFGNAVKLGSRKSLDVAVASLQLFHSALSTRDAVDRKEKASKTSTKKKA